MKTSSALPWVASINNAAAISLMVFMTWKWTRRYLQKHDMPYHIKRHFLIRWTCVVCALLSRICHWMELISIYFISSIHINAVTVFSGLYGLFLIASTFLLMVITVERYQRLEMVLATSATYRMLILIVSICLLLAGVSSVYCILQIVQGRQYVTYLDDVGNNLLTACQTLFLFSCTLVESIVNIRIFKSAFRAINQSCIGFTPSPTAQGPPPPPSAIGSNEHTSEMPALWRFKRPWAVMKQKEKRKLFLILSFILVLDITAISVFFGLVFAYKGIASDASNLIASWSVFRVFFSYKLLNLFQRALKKSKRKPKIYHPLTPNPDPTQVAPSTHNPESIAYSINEAYLQSDDSDF